MSGVDFKSPVEKILDLLESLKQTIKNKKLAAEIDWAIDIISHNKLYEPLLDSSNEEDGAERADVMNKFKLVIKLFRRMFGLKTTASFTLISLLLIKEVQK